jgi:hypothetical protein
MNHDEIERALRDDETITPSPDFSARVMRAVRQEAEDLGAIRFPWSRALPGLILCVLGLAAGLVTSPPPAAELRFLNDAVAKTLQVVPATTLIMALAPLLGSWILVRLTFRYCGYRE